MGYTPFEFSTPDGESVFGKGIGQYEWVEWERTTPICGSCRYDLEPVDKRHGGWHWIWTLTCPCCDREVDVKQNQTEAECTVEAVQEEYVSGLMSEESLEESLDTVLGN